MTVPRSSRPPSRPKPLSLARVFGGARLVVIGGTGFLGKVWWVLMLHRFPELGRLYLVVRPRNGQSAEDRLWNDVAKSECLKPLEEQHGEGLEQFLRDKVRVLEGDIVRPYCGLSQQARDELRGSVDAVVNASGIVDFQPPLDIGLEVNAFGMQSLVQLARDVGNSPILHTSTCYVAGYRPGIVEELDPTDHPFPYAGKLDPELWDPDREIAECLDIIEQAKHRANDAFRQSHFLDQAKHNLTEAGEPAKGAVLKAEIERVRRKFVEQQLAEFGQERAKFWGWPNTYTYTKSIGEQIVAKSKLPFTIVRPAIVESCVAFPMQGWNEGVNTSAPLIFAVREGQQQFPGAAIRLDIIPCDMVATGICLALGELLDGTQKPVYQFGTSDSNPTTMARIYELSGLYKRKYFKRTGRGSPLVNFLQMHVEGALMPTKKFEKMGPRAMSKGAATVANLIDKTVKGPLDSLVAPTIKNLRKFSHQQAKIADIIGQFAPFTADLDYEFRCDNTRAANARLEEAERSSLYWTPETIDWRLWFLETHIPGLERWVFPELERRLQKPLRPLKRHETLTGMLQEMAERHGLAVALQRTEPDGLSRYSYRDWYERALACAARLTALGVEPGHRVVLVARNHPEWPIAFFGILFAGATAVPLEADLDQDTFSTLLGAALPKVVLLDSHAHDRLSSKLEKSEWILLSEAAAPGAPGIVADSAEEDVACLFYTSPTSGAPKGVMLSHFNLTSLIASLAPLFPLGRDDRVLSVLPLHHTFELACGMLLPLSRGARIIYLDELSSARLEYAMAEGRPTALVGVPALWEMLERRILAQVEERGAAASRVFNLALEFNRVLGKNLGVDAGRLLFGPVHRALGGQMKFLVSGGAALNPQTHRLFAGLGLHLAEGYGLTEASPVLAVARAGPRSRPGQVGRAVPGVEIRIDAPNADGVGEVLARGPNVMVGYAGDPEATRAALSEDGWLRTGDLGKVDHRGRLQVVGRSKDVIVSTSGENVYPDDVEARLGVPPHCDELAIVSVGDGKGGERVACVAVATASRQVEAKAELEQAIAALPKAMRPALVRLRSETLPRTTTGRVKRAEVGAWLEAELERTKQAREALADGIVRQTLARLTRRPASAIAGSDTLRGDLGCDSLLLLELLGALEKHLGHAVDAERLSAAGSVADVERLLGERPTPRVTRAQEGASAAPSLAVPAPLREAGMALLGRAQRNFYDGFMRTRVSGRAFIPKNKNLLVVANHASHLDMGLVKFALGDYGKKLVALAAEDYFFEGRLKKTFFENFSNMVPVSRSTSLREGLETAKRLLGEGNVVLLFPEGTRSKDGSLSEFKPMVGAVALEAGVDVLPIWLSGTFEALPKGATLIRSRNLTARIGLPLGNESLRAHTQGASASDAARKVAMFAHHAVSELSQGRVFELPELSSRARVEDEASVSDAGAQNGASPVTTEAAPSGQVAAPDVLSQLNQNGGVRPLFVELEQRFREGSIKRPTSYYFAVGDERFTLKLSPTRYELEEGRTLERADCVFKATPEMFRRIVLEGYTPSAREFMSGAVKSNNIPALKEFQRVFQLEEKRGSGGIGKRMRSKPWRGGPG